MQDSGSLRAFDRHLGRIACRVAGWPHRLKSLFTRSPLSTSTPPSKVLLVELFEMGAAVMLIPSINYLKSINPEVEIHVLTTRMCESIWKAIDDVDAKRVHVVQTKNVLTFLFSGFKTLLSLRKNKFDLIIDYELFMRVPALMTSALRTGRRAGFFKYDLEGLDRGDFYEAKCAFNQNTHISKNFLSLTRVAVEGGSATPNYKGQISEEDLRIAPASRFVNESRGARLPETLRARDYVIVFPDVGPNLSMRNYPSALLAEALRGLRAVDPDLVFVLMGSEENKSCFLRRPGAQALLETSVDLMGKTGFDEMLDLIAGAKLLITNDAGPAHFAALTNTKTLALFSTDSPFVYGPLGPAVIAYTHFQCSPCISAYNHKVSRCDDNQCLKVLSPELVTDLAVSILENRARLRTINNETPYLLSPPGPRRTRQDANPIEKFRKPPAAV